MTETRALERGWSGREVTWTVGGPRRTREEEEEEGVEEGTGAAAASEGEEFELAASSRRGPTAASTREVTDKTTSKGFSKGAFALSTAASPTATRLEAEGGGAIPCVCSLPAPPKGVLQRRSSLPKPAAEAAAAAREEASPPSTLLGFTSQTKEAAPLGGIGGGGGGGTEDGEEGALSLFSLSLSKPISDASSPGEGSNLGGSRARNWPLRALSIVASTSTAGFEGEGGKVEDLSFVDFSIVVASAGAGLTLVLTPSGAAAEKLKYCDRCLLSPVAGTV